MHESVYAYVKRHTRKLDAQHVLEVGSYNVNGSVRDLFPDVEEYVGVDIAEGPGVDRVVSAHYLDEHFMPGLFDLVLCLEMLEHDECPWLTVPQLTNMVRPGGTVIVTARGNGFPLHNRPDRWRFLKDGMASLLTYGGLTVNRLDDDPQVSGLFAVCTRKATG